MNIGIYLYDQAEVLDFAGPFEVFSTAKRVAGLDWQVYLLAENKTPVKARGGLDVIPHYSIYDHPPLDLLVVAGGVHTAELGKTSVIDWLREQSGLTPRLASVCTGAFLLAEAGLLSGKTVTTHWEDIDDLRSRYPELEVLERRRWVEEGALTTSGGISAGIDMSLFLVSQLASLELAQHTARQMEYDWRHV